MLRRVLVLSALLLCGIVPLAAAELYPVSAEADSYAPERGETLRYWIDLEALRSVDVIVEASVYVPGYGWSGWEVLWEGRMYRGERRTVYGSYYVPSDAGAGSVVVHYLVYYWTPSDYQVLAGDEYYGELHGVHVAGSLPDPDAEYWRSQAEYWESAYYWLEDYCESLSRELEELEEEYSSLESDYEELERSYDALKSNYEILEEEYDSLKAEYDRLRREYGELLAAKEELERERYAPWLLPVLVALAGGAIAAYLSCRRRAG